MSPSSTKKCSITKREEFGDLEGCVPRSHSFDKELVQPTPHEDLEVLPPGVIAAASQVRLLNYRAVVRAASTVVSPTCRERNLATRHPNAYCVCASNRSCTCNQAFRNCLNFV